MTLRILKIFLLFPLCIFALEIQRDNQNEFVFTDKVAALNDSPCPKDGPLPEIPSRTYTIALPNSSLPSVNVENLKTERINYKPCGSSAAKQLQISKPFLKDNLWRVKISVPLLYSSGNSWHLRKDFRVRVNFSGKASGHLVGKRALASVENKKAAARFGTQQISSRIASKSSLENISWLLRIGVGSKDLSTSADGMHAVSFDELRRIAGSAIDGIAIKDLRLFSASPDTLTEEIFPQQAFPNAVEIPIKIINKNGNDIFDSGDSIAFFGYGTAIWKKTNSPSGMDYYFSNSPYSFYQYFYLGTSKIGEGKRFISDTTKASAAKERDIAWKKYVRSEKDLLLQDNYLGESRIEENTGKEWFWAWGARNGTVTVNANEFQNSVRALTGLQGNDALIGVSFFPRRSTSVNPQFSASHWKEKMKGINFNFYFQGQRLTNIIDTIPGGTFVFAASTNAASNSYRLEILSGFLQNDRFDGLSVAYNYNVAQSSGNEWLFPGTQTGAISIPVPANMELIKTENFIPVKILEGTNGFANDIISSERDTKYFLHRKGSYRSPAIIEAIPNRTSSVSEPLKIPENTEYLILTSEILQNSAVKLKQFRESGAAPTTFRTAVVLAEDIYRDHGAQKNSPVAIRDYIRFAKDRCQNLKYVLLAGSGHYDYRNIKGGTKSNFMPPYEAEDMSTDDFFAVLDQGESIRFGTYMLSLAIGRLPVSNANDFENYIQKVKDYENVASMDNGIWRNTIIFAADDAMQGTVLDPIRDHTDQMERTITHIDTTLAQEQGFAVNWRKISLLQYERDGNNKKPDAARELLLRLNQGALFSFFYGHGNAVMWADEDLLNTSSLNNIFNKGRYTILGSFSCLVARFDDAVVPSLSEAFVNAKDKGAIASIGSLRESYPTYNEALAKGILNQSLATDTLLGAAILRAKRNVGYAYSSQRYNNEKYALLGEPVLNMPTQKIALNLDSVPNKIQALQKLRISGKASVQTGAVRIQILEGEKQRTLWYKDGRNPDSTQIKVEGIPIYSEELPIRNGAFSTEFITSRKLSLGDTSAQIRLWSYKPGTAGVGKSAIRGIKLDGTSSYADSIKDNTPPDIKIFPCMRSGIAAPYAENAQITLEIPACLEVVVEDSTGIDYREEADEGIAFEVSPGASSWHPWPFIEQTGKRAVARMTFNHTYDPGEYVFKVNAQDILGNMALRSLRVSLSSEIKEGLADVFNVPNPMKKGITTFYFKDLSGERHSNVTIKIFDQNGRPVKTINNAISGVTTWDGRDSRGRLLANGLYHYIVQSTIYSLNETGSRKKFEKKQKLVISR